MTPMCSLCRRVDLYARDASRMRPTDGWPIPVIDHPAQFGDSSNLIAREAV